MQLAPGFRLGAYEVLGPLGAGGMGEVYRARDTRLGREVALKVLPSDVASSPERLARFEHEARTVAGLNHPNIVTLYSVEHESGIRFLTMEMVEGRTLAAQVRIGGLPLARLFEVAIPLADALVAAHEKGVIHRDLKPDNVMVTGEGRVKVLDFGLAKLVPADANVALSQAATQAGPASEVGMVAGTLPYMAPEQVRGGPVDARSDVFSLGVILYELATGRRPFLGASAADVASSILRDAPPPLQALRGDLPADVIRVIGRCLEKDPARRYQAIKEARNELELARRTSESGARAALGPAGTPVRAAPSIAVLPFENRGRDEADEYFADGITEDVIAQLCKVRTLTVISRSSVIPFKGHRENLPDIAAKLGVAHLLEGSVRRVGDRLRIVVQLVEPASGRNLWAETYDRRLTDVFEIQTEVALQIAAALQAELTSSERERIQREPTRDIVAYELYLRGRQSLLQFHLEGYRRAIEYFDRAIERDPAFAPAYVGLAITCTEMVENGQRDREQVGLRARAAAEKAVALDPELGGAHCALAYVRAVIEMDWPAAEQGFRRALELSPGDAFAYDLYGRTCAAVGRLDEAITLHERAQELDPLVHRVDLATSLLRAGRNEDAARVARRCIEADPDYARGHATLGWALFNQGRTDEGIAALERATALLPTDGAWLAQLGEAYGLAGETERAREILRRLEDPARPTPASPYHLAYVYTGLGEAERALDCLERAYASGSGPLYSIKGSFLLAPLRNHPRFVALLERMHAA